MGALSVTLVDPQYMDGAAGHYCCSPRRVEIDNRYGDSGMLGLIVYHELGHWLGIPHFDSDLDIMNTYLTMDLMFYWDDLIGQMQDRYLTL